MTAPRKQVMTMPMHVEHEVLGYLVNCLLSERMRAAIVPLQDKLERQFPSAIWRTPVDALHITLMDWLTPVTDYGSSKDELYRELAPRYIEVFERAVSGQHPIKITFDTIEAFSGAVVVKGHDDGSIQQIRQQFLSEITLLPGTKIQEPSFIHSTICRFLKPIELGRVKAVVEQQAIDAEERIAELWLTRETGFSMQEYDIVKRFKLL